MTFQRLTIDDVARIAGVSRTTASMVLNGHAERYRIAQATVERVEQVARELHFSPSHSARSLRNRRSQAIGLVIPDLTNASHAALAQALENLCRARDLQLLMVTSDEDPERESAGMTQLVARQVDGILVVPCSSDARHYQKWTRRLPLVFVDRRLDDSGIPSVVTDATDSVVQLLAPRLAAGISELVYFGGQAALSPSRDRLAGYRQALANAGLTEQPGWVCERDFLRESGYAMMRDWHAANGRYPQALFTASITLLEGVLAYLRQHGLHDAPRSMMTFDHHALLDCLPLAIDAVQQDSEGLAVASLAKVLALLEGQPLPATDTRIAATLLRSPHGG